LRNLDQTNPAMAKPVRLASNGAVIPLVFGTLSIILAKDAAPTVPFTENPVSLFGALIIVLAVGMLLTPRLFRWGWESSYFGASLFNIGSLSLIFFAPYLCLVIYSKLSISTRATILFAGIVAHIIWCHRFVVLYKNINKEEISSNLIYQEESDAVYYMQKTDKYLIEEKFKFEQFPKGRYFVLFTLFSLSLIPFASTIRSMTGIPFIHVFFVVGTIPISLMVAGISTRTWLIFYYYPKRIRASTNKQVFVDMSEKTSANPSPK
jgi:hypothetical protein